MFHATSLQQLHAFGVERAAITCGIFDGLHLGHQAIVHALLELAAASDATPVVVTFDPHPQQVLHPDHAPKLLLSTQHKLHLLAREGVAATVVMPFTSEFSQLAPEAFLDHVILDAGIGITGICVGRNWRFGRGASGDAGLLRQAGAAHNFEVTPVPETDYDGATVSSTRLRAALAAGDLQLCQAMLGRRYSIMGRVEFGKGLATSDLHYPTANVACGQGLFPPLGIYAAYALIPEAEGSAPKRHPGVLYLGQSPTYFDQPPPRPFLEMHIFDFQEDLYGRPLEVEFVQFLRADRKFESVDALSEQIGRDVAAARELLAALP